MIYKRYGSVFRQIREQRKISLNFFVSIGLSKGTVSKFERGISMMAFDKVVSALQLMGVSLAEFEEYLNDYTLSDSEVLLEQMEEAIIENDDQLLAKVSEESEKGGFHFISLAAQTPNKQFNSEFSDEIANHFYEIDLWSYKELCIFYFTMEYLGIKDMFHILNRFLENGHIIFNSAKHKNYLTQACCRAIIIFSQRGYKDYGKYVIDMVLKHELAHTMFLCNQFKGAKGYWIYCFEDKLKGSVAIQRSIDMLYTYNPKVAKYYQNLYDEMIN